MITPTSGNPGRNKKDEGLKKVFSELNRKFEEQAIQRQAGSLGLPYFELGGFPIDPGALRFIAEDDSKLASAIPFFKEGKKLRIGVVDPANTHLKTVLDQLIKQKFEPELFLVSPTAFELSLQQYKKLFHFVPTSAPHEIAVEIFPDSLDRVKNLTVDPLKLKSSSASELLGLLISAATLLNASDIHIEPGRGRLALRFRIDGVLQEIVTWPIELLPRILSRIKLLSNLKLNITTLPQDGRFTAMLQTKNVDIRASILPSSFGESVVLRLLGVGFQKVGIEELGFNQSALDVIYLELKKPNGLILTTGPTGAGKTTTLYSFLKFLNKPGVKIITLEDPVEYELAGITQTPIDKSRDLDFAKALGSILRQDPNIVMVGEIRDYETAEITCQAALTGHMVFSTLHTNDSAGAIPRLLDLGVKPVSLAPALSLVIAERLLRRICPSCKEIYKLEPEELSRVKLALSQIPTGSKVKAPETLAFYHSKGCDKCHNLGYLGRVGVFEVFAVDENIEKLIYDQASSQEIKKAALAAGMVTMQQDAILKALEGITDLAEVWRVTES